MIKKQESIIIGCSRLGAGIAGLLNNRQFHVTIIDKDMDAFRKLSESFSGYQLLGNGSDVALLKRAGVESADMVIVTTDDDNSNILISQIAARIFKVPQVYVRLHDSRKECLVTPYAIHAICPFVLSIEAFMKKANIGGMTNEDCYR